MTNFITSLLCFWLGFSGAMVFAAGKGDKLTLSDITMEPLITVMVLYNKPGVPDGWYDSTTRPDATDLCNYLIATQSPEYATPVSRSRCIFQVQE